MNPHDIFHHVIDAAMTAGLGVVGWIGTRIVKKLDLLEKHETRLAVDKIRLDGHDKVLDRHEKQLAVR